jgi:hypothetical protein
MTRPLRCLALLSCLLAAGCGSLPGLEEGGRQADTGNARLRVAAAAEESGQAQVALSMYAAAAAAEPGSAPIQARFVAALLRGGHVAQAGQVVNRALARQAASEGARHNAKSAAQGCAAQGRERDRDFIAGA